MRSSVHSVSTPRPSAAGVAPPAIEGDRPEWCEDADPAPPPPTVNCLAFASRNLASSLSLARVARFVLRRFHQKTMKIAATSKVIPITDEGATIDEKNNIIWDTEGARPPVWEEKVVY